MKKAAGKTQTSGKRISALKKELRILRQKVKKLSTLFHLGQQITATLYLEDVLVRILDSTEKVLKCERSSIWKVDKEKGDLELLIMGRGDIPEEGFRLGIGEGIAGWTVEHGKPLIIQDVNEDPRWSPSFDSKSGFETRSIICAPLVINERIIGSIQLLNKKGERSFTEEDLELLVNMSAPIAIALENASLYEENQKNFISWMMILAEAVEKRDTYTGGHVQRVLSYSIAIGKRMGLGSKELEDLRYAAILHDLGKVWIDSSILNKEEDLNEKEYGLMKRHAEIGAEIIEHAGISREIAAGIRHHHERFDGLGYPSGLKGGEIPLLARIIAVVDTYDAITTTRSYREGLKYDHALSEIKRNSGSQFCPEVVKVFLEAFDSGEIDASSEDVRLGGKAFYETVKL